MTVWSKREAQVRAEIAFQNSRWRRYAGIFWVSLFRGLGWSCGVLVVLTILGLHWRG